MEQSMKKQHWSVAVIALAIGLILGAFLYSRIIGSGSIPQTPTVNVEAEQFVHEGILPDVVRISPGAQKEMGITVETATLRNLQDTLSAKAPFARIPDSSLISDRWLEALLKKPMSVWAIVFLGGSPCWNMTISKWVSLLENTRACKPNFSEVSRIWK